MFLYYKRAILPQLRPNGRSQGEMAVRLMKSANKDLGFYFYPSDGHFTLDRKFLKSGRNLFITRLLVFLNFLVLLSLIRLNQAVLFQVKLGQVKLVQIELAQVQLVQVKFVQIELVQVKFVQIKLVQVKLDQVRLGWVSLSQASLGQIKRFGCSFKNMCLIERLWQTFI